MHLGMVQHIVQVQVIQCLSGGLTESCLPRSEKLLRSHLTLLRMLRNRIEGAPYKSVMDAVLCCFLPDQKPACIAYYEERGPQLNKLFSPKGLAAIDSHIFNCISTLRTTYQGILENELWAKGTNHSPSAFDAALEAVGWES